MASVTGYTAARMQQIEDQAIVGGHINGDNLILDRHNGGTINAGNVRGPQGVPGPSGSVGGTLGANDNRLVRSDGTSGTTVQGSLVEVDDFGRVTAPLMTVTTAPSVGNDVVNKTYSDKSGRGVLSHKVHNSTVLTNLPQDAFYTISALDTVLTPVVGRYYRFTASALGYPMGSPGLIFGMSLWRSIDSLAFLGSMTHLATLTGPAEVNFSKVFPIPSGWNISTTFRIKVWTNGSVNIQNDFIPASLTIEDVGEV